MLKTLKILICLVIVATIMPTNASAATSYNHQELSQYKGYGEVMYETVVDQTTFITGQYTDNKQYVKDTASEIKDYAKFWLNEKDVISSKCSGMSLFTSSCVGELVSSGAGFMLTVGDTIKNLFTDYGDKLQKEYNESIILDGVYFTTVVDEYSRYTFMMKPGYKIVFNGGIEYKAGEKFNFNRNIFLGTPITEVYAVVNSKELGSGEITRTEYNLNKSIFEFWFQDFNTATSTMRKYINGFNYQILTSDNQGIIAKDRVPITVMKDYLDKMDKMVLPEPKAYLNCPDGTRIDMVINGSTFLDATGQVMQVSKDGVANVSSQICNLNWEKPQIDYVDDVAAIEDSKGNWLDLVTGDLLKCVLTDNCKDLIEKDEEDKVDKINPVDKSLLQYVKNAYEYATSTLKVATDGLKSLGNGAKGITELFGIFFGWLPKEMIVLMTSGLGIMIGLRIFRK